MNTKFQETDKDIVNTMTKFYAQILAVLLNADKPLLQTIIYMNENFEDIYFACDNDVDRYKYIFDEMGIEYKKI